MNMMTIKCPKCGGEAKLSLVDTDYSGPRRCWKCREYFTITIYHNQLTSCVPLSREEYERQQETQKVAEKSRGGIDFSKQEQLAMSLDSPVKPSSGIDFSRHQESGSLQKAAEQSRGGIDFVKPEQPAMPQNPPEKPQSGIDFAKKEEPAIPPKPWQDFIRPVNPEEPSEQAAPKKPSNIFPPDPIRTFVPLEDIKEEPKKPERSKKHTDMFNPFIPPAT
jgi:hypothetical protein